jgi:hypothetical protein
VDFPEESFREEQVAITDIGDTNDEDAHSPLCSMNDTRRDVHQRSLADGVLDPIEDNQSFSFEDVVQLGRSLVVVLTSSVDIHGMNPGRDIFILPTD